MLLFVKQCMSFGQFHWSHRLTNSENTKIRPRLCPVERTSWSTIMIFESRGFKDREHSSSTDLAFMMGTLQHLALLARTRVVVCVLLERKCERAMRVEIAYAWESEQADNPRWQNCRQTFIMSIEYTMTPPLRGGVSTPSSLSPGLTAVFHVNVCGFMCTQLSYPC